MNGQRYFLAVRYEAAADGALDQARNALRAVDMTEIARDSDLLVMIGDGMKCRATAERCWLIGDVYRKEGMQPPGQSFDGQASIRAYLKELLSDFWGGYIAVAHEEVSNTFYILRDPSGALPAYWTLANGLFMIASDIDLMIEAGTPRPSVDWSQLAHFLMSPNARPAATCLEKISELRRGELLTVRQASLSVENLWWPWDYVGHLLSGDDAPGAIRQSVMRAVGHLTQGKQKLLLSLSGGLDSSIIAASLSAASANFTALTLTTPDPAGDERTWAAMVAGHLGFRLDEATIDAARIDLTRSEASHLPRPVSRSLRQEIDRLSREQADRIGAEAHIGGAGGDSVFCHISSATALSDRFLVAQVRSGSGATLYDLAAMTGVSHVKILKQALMRLPRSRRVPIDRRDMSMLSPGLGDLPLLPNHPWLVAPGDALPGKWRHIRELIAIENHIDGLRCATDRPHIAPLMSQPVLETALSIPTWLWCVGGLNRSPARCAFADQLPDAIIARRLKGSPDSVGARAFEGGRAVLHDLLVGGLLDQAGLIERGKITNYLAQRGPLRDHGYLRLLTLANAEAWARHWQAR